jgi:acyl-CoA reductase-like NAD-dependent aldehyde dehydrogenase/alcohol dehydrogenase class IV
LQRERIGTKAKSAAIQLAECNALLINRTGKGDEKMDHYKLFINGAFVEAQDGKTFETYDPGNDQPIATVAQAGAADAEAAIAAARRAFDSGVWSGLTPSERAQKMYDFADQINLQALRLAMTESMDAGQIINFSKVTPLGFGANMLKDLAHYASFKFPWEEEIPVQGNPFDFGRDYLRREPIGVCVGIIPWNFPMVMAFWKIGQAIIMGNSVVLKPASVTPLTALIIAEASKAAGIPDGVINVIPGAGAELGKTLCTHPDVDRISFTGSTEVGREIMRMAAGTVKKVTLELGGKSANIILDDADLETAVSGAAFGTFFHQGQVCESGTRILVHAKIYDEFMEKLKARTEKLRVGYQLLPTTHLGPLVSHQQVEVVDGYVQLGLKEGAELVTGGKRVQVEGIEGGCYYAPTIFTQVRNDMRIAQEEIFGPVVSVMKFESDEEAAAIANDSIYGLAGGIFSSNTARAEKLAHQVRTGTMWINNYHYFGHFCPFGGYKQSGIGRELGHKGLAEYTQVKRIHVTSFADAESNFTMAILSDSKRLKKYVYHCPTKINAGHGSLASVAKEVADLGCRRVLLMTDEGVRKAGLAQLVKDALSDFCVGVFDNIPQDTDLETVDAATDLARKLEVDCIVSVGGGSVIDTAKAVCVTLKNGGCCNDNISWSRLNEPQTPHIVIPTTSGTGSEVTWAAVIKNKFAGRKSYIIEARLAPNVAILDPRFTMTLPPKMTAATAMDAMTHAIEALTTITTNPISDGQALHAIRLIKENLPIAMEDGGNEDARLNLQAAATMAGCAFTISFVALAHAMAHTVGMLYNVPHGAACGIMLPKVMRFNVDHATQKLALIALALGVNTFEMDEREAALAAADEVEKLMKQVGHPLQLREFGVPEDGLMDCTMHALGDPVSLYNARPVESPEQVLELFKQVY